MSLSKRDTFVRYLDPLKLWWEDAEGGVHFSAYDACVAMGVEPTKENMQDMVDIMADVMSEAPEIKVRHEPDSPDYFTQGNPPQN